MKKLLALTTIAGGVTLALMIGQRMSTEAMAVVIGVVFGVAASIPTSLLIVAATRGTREEPRLHGPDPQPTVTAPPQIYVVTPPAHPSGASVAPWLQGNTPAILPPAGFGHQETPRRFKVVGEDEYWVMDD
jgi:hypothetical protein